MNKELLQDLAAWRRELRKSRHFDDGYVEELESHLLDAYESHLQSGLDHKQAFERASEGLGDPGRIETESLKLSHQSSLNRQLKETMRSFTILLPSYFRTGLRSLFRHKGYSFINIFGLSVGLACAFVIVLFVNDELSYDRFHSKADRLYRLSAEVTKLNETQHAEATPAPAIPLMVDDFEDVEMAARFVAIRLGERRVWSNEENKFYENNILSTDSTFFQMFDFPVVAGRTKNTLNSPSSVVISTAMAEKYYPGEIATGQELWLDLFGNTASFIVEAVVDIPENSQFDFDVMFSFSYFENLQGSARAGFDNYVMNWANPNVYSYLLLKAGADPEALEASLPAFIKRHWNAPGDTDITLRMQPMTDVYLHNQAVSSGFAKTSDITYVYVFTAVGFLILLIAGINFTNLATARSTERSREVGVRKALGARKQQLIGQFLGESIMMSALAFGVAIVGVWMALPWFNSMFGKSLDIWQAHPAMVIAFAAAALGTGMIAGFYPAFVLAGFKAVQVLKGRIFAQTGRSRFAMRKVLVVTQFAASSALLIGTAAISNQLNFMNQKKLGFNKEQVMMIPLREMDAQQRGSQFRDEILSIAGVNSGSVMTFAPGEPSVGQTAFYVDGSTNPETAHSVNFWPADYGFEQALGIELADGRFFSRETSADANGAFIINRAAADYFGWDNPLAHEIDWHMPGPGGTESVGKGPVVGLVEDFHYASLHESIEPLIIVLPTNVQWLNRKIAVRVNTSDLASTTTAISTVWAEFFPEAPFESYFLDQQFAQLYQAEQLTGTIFRTFAILAIIIASMGLLGLAAFITSQKTKEIGVRKVLGATIPEIIREIATPFLRLVATGFLVAVPLAWFGINQWLSGFAYKAELSIGIFLVLGLLTMAAALVTVSYHAITAARRNPVRSLRYE